MSNRTTLLRASVAAVGAALAATAAALDPRDFVAGWPIEAPAGAEVFDVPLTAEVYAAADEHRAARGARCQRRAAIVLPPRPAAGAADRAARRARGVAAVRRRRDERAERRRHDERGRHVGHRHARRGELARDHRLRARCARRRGGPRRARARLARAAAAVPARRRRRAEHGPHGLAQRRTSVGRGALGRRRRGAARARARARRSRRLSARHAEPRSCGLAPAARDARQLLPTEPATPISVRVAPLPRGRRARRRACPDALYFDAGGPLPVSSPSTLAFGDNDGWVRADVAASRSLDGPWMPVAYGELFYALSFEGREFASEPARGRPARGALLARRAGGAAARRAPRARARVSAGIAARRGRRRRALSARGRNVGRGGRSRSRRSPPCGRSSSRRPTSCRARRSASAASSAGPPRSSRARRFPWRTAALWTVLIGGRACGRDHGG